MDSSINPTALSTTQSMTDSSMSSKKVSAALHEEPAINSEVLSSILLSDKDGSCSSTDEFFASTWQRRPRVFPFQGDGPVGATDGGDGRWNDGRVTQNLHGEMIHQGWYLLVDMLERAYQEQNRAVQQLDAGTSQEHQTPLFFQNQELLCPEKVKELYGSSGFAAYLDGASIVLNHADLLSPWIAALCQDLQKSFPHAYANCYVTPPHSQAVPVHADDRDVLIFQIVGSKQWSVYQTVPVPFPYPHEQVGKEGLAVPQNVLDGPKALHSPFLILKAGDVLYMPRGFVHEAKCTDQLSFHITIALATHDWSLAGNMTSAVRSILTQNITWRQSILPLPSSKASAMTTLQVQIEQAMQEVRKQVTAEAMIDGIRSRIEEHNRKALAPRMKLINDARHSSVSNNSNDCLGIAIANGTWSGPAAAAHIHFHSNVRATNEVERQAFQAKASTTTQQPSGLHVREDIADSIFSIVQALKGDTSKVVQVLHLKREMTVMNTFVDDFAVLCLVKRAVALGAMALVVVVS